MSQYPSLRDWFHVQLSDHGIKVRKLLPPQIQQEYEIEWKSLIRVVLKTAEDFLDNDELYLFTDERPESFVIPMEADGALELMNQLIDRKLFDAELAIQAASSAGGLFVWPPLNKNEQG
jgi:hypothetical protein